MYVFTMHIELSLFDLINQPILFSIVPALNCIFAMYHHSFYGFIFLSLIT